MDRGTGRPHSWLLPGVLFMGVILAHSAQTAEAGPPRADKPKEIEIKGSEKFQKRVTKALQLLKEKAPDAHEIVSEHVRRIEQGRHSGMWAYKTPPTYEMTERTAFYSLTWCAGSIAHDSLHSKLYRDYKKQHSGSVPDEVWTGRDAETKCLKHQLDVLKKIGAAKHEIEYCSKLKGTHHDANKDGKYDWEDHKTRDW